MTVTRASFSAAREIQEDQDVSRRDPLRADAIMAVLAEANERRDVPWVLAQAQRLAADCRVTATLDARAALRDLGFLLASAVRHDPGTDLAPFECTLRYLGEAADEVPRDNVYSYATRNPQGPRRRTFTGMPEEELFISSVAESISSLNSAVEQIGTALLEMMRETEDLSSHRLFTEALVVGRRSVGVLQSNLIRVKRQVTPELFSTRLRPYFPTLAVDGIAYAAPGGAQMPLLAVDVMLFTHQATGDDLRMWHEEYVRENIQYLPPAHRSLCAEVLALEGAEVRRRIALLTQRDTVRAAYRELLEGVLKFRHPHRQMARENMRIRPDGSLGSGGYSDTVLDKIIEVNLNSLRSLPKDVE